MAPPHRCPSRQLGRPARFALALLSAGGLSACTGEVSGSGPILFFDAGIVLEVGVDAGPRPDASGPDDLGPAPDAGDPSRTEVPLDLPALTVATSSCSSLRPGERALSVDPEGHLWLGRTASGSVQLRVLDGWGELPERTYATRYQAITDLIAETATTASVLADGAPWFFEDGVRLQISAPFTVGPDATACGNLRSQAFVASEGELYQRLDEQWIQWQGLEQALNGSGRLIPRDGSCFGASDEVWLASGQLETWALSPTSITRTSSVVGARDPVAREQELLAVVDGELIEASGSPRTYVFAHGSVRRLAAGGHYAWLVAGDALLRFDGARFEVGGPEIAEGEVDLYPYAAGGVWVAAAGSVCAIAPASMLRVGGLRSGFRSTAERFALRARPRDPTADVSARVDGTEIAPTRVVDGWLSFEAPLALGWSEVELQVVVPDGITRSLGVKREPTVSRSWQTDVRPIYQAHCARSGCHVADSTSGAPELSTYDAWVALADRVELRVVDRRDMPPSASQNAEWGMETVRVIEEWLGGGLKP